jgi:SAM-dependent methyltransferase
LKDEEDAFGHQIFDYFHGKAGREIIERDDGLVEVSTGPEYYFSGYHDWMIIEQKALTYVKGFILDIGCGAGRHSLYLQEKGYEIVGIDISPLAIKVCKLRGLKSAYIQSLNDLTPEFGIFDTILMLGNTFGLSGSFENAKKLLKQFYDITSKEGRLIILSRDPYKTDVKEHLDYHERNRIQGRMAGQAKIRVRYKKYATPWLHFLIVSQQEMEEILEDSFWKVTKYINGERGQFIVILNKSK